MEWNGVAEYKAPSVRELLDNAAAKYGDRTFIKFLCEGRVEERSFNRLREDSLAVCRYIRSIGTEKTHIAIAALTSYEYIVFITGILISGNVAVPFAPTLSEKEALSLFKRADIEMLFYDNAFNCTPAIRDSLNYKIAPVNITGDGLLDGIVEKYSSTSEYASLSDCETDINECAVIIYTSGTSGTKKGVMLSMNAFVGNIMYDEYVDCFGEDSVALSVLPMYHCYCLSGDYIKNLKDGMTVCLNSSMRDLPDSLKTFEPTVMRLVPMIAQTLLKLVKMKENRHPELTPRQAAEAVFGKNIQWLISGGAYLDPELVTEYGKLGIFLRQGFGMTEAGGRVSVPDTKCTTESIGRLTNMFKARIEHGEIQIYGPTLMLGYYKMPEETAEAFTQDGWLRTGDIGEVTESGELFITGRRKNLIILSSGENVSPEAIEKKFAQYEIVSEVLVYAENDRIVADIYPDYSYCEENDIPDPGSVITAIVKQMNSGAKASHLIAQVNVLTSPLPRTESGKIMRKKVEI
ncbi:MAG: AMP-binding protein [Clostridia bacterium]|nr:AMP-binding protein [Clostridia bacterium]